MVSPLDWGRHGGATPTGKVARLIDAQVPGIGDPLLMSFGINGIMIDGAGLFAVGSRWECEIAAAAYVAETGRSWLESQAIARRAFTEAELVIQKSAPLASFYWQFGCTAQTFPGRIEIRDSFRCSSRLSAILCPTPSIL